MTYLSKHEDVNFEVQRQQGSKLYISINLMMKCISFCNEQWVVDEMPANFLQL